MTLMSLTSTWAPPLIMRQTGCKEDVVSYLMGVVVAFSIIGALVGGRVGDIFSEKEPQEQVNPACNNMHSLTSDFGCCDPGVDVHGAGQRTGYGRLYSICHRDNSKCRYLYGRFAYSHCCQPGSGFARPERNLLGTCCFQYVPYRRMVSTYRRGISDALGGDVWGVASGIMRVGMSGLACISCYYMSSRYFVQDWRKSKIW